MEPWGNYDHYRKSFFEINEQKKCFNISTFLAIIELFETN